METGDLGRSIVTGNIISPLANMSPFTYFRLASCQSTCMLSCLWSSYNYFKILLTNLNVYLIAFKVLSLQYEVFKSGWMTGSSEIWSQPIKCYYCTVRLFWGTCIDIRDTYVHIKHTFHKEREKKGSYSQISVAMTVDCYCAVRLHYQ